VVQVVLFVVGTVLCVVRAVLHGARAPSPAFPPRTSSPLDLAASGRL